MGNRVVVLLLGILIIVLSIGFIEANPYSFNLYESPIISNTSNINVNDSQFWRGLATPADINLTDLGNVNVPSPSDGSILSYDSILNLWESISQSTLRWIVDTSNGFLYNNSNTVFFNDTHANVVFVNESEANERYFNKTDLRTENQGWITYNRTVEGNNVTMTSLSI